MTLRLTYNKARTSLGAGLAMVIAGLASPAFADEPTMSDEAFEASKHLYFQQCAGCHGVLRAGATGKNLQPEWSTTAADGTVTEGGTLALGHDRLARIIAYGTEGGMNNFDGILSEEQISDLATYIMMEPPQPPEMSLAMMRESRIIHIAEEDYPTEPLHGRNWENFFVSIERDAGMVAVIDGDTHEVLAHIPTGYAVHVMKASEHHNIEEPEHPGRFWYTMGRDGKMTKIDLWQNPENMLVAEVRIAYDARDVAVSGDGRYVIGGGYWPPHFVIVDGQTMEPLKVVSTRGVNIDGEYVEEARVAAIYTTPNETTWLVAVKELGQMWQVDYSDLDNLRIDVIDSAKFLHDGFFDPTGRYFQIAANASNTMVVIDSEERALEALIPTDSKPHPGPGANWIDPNCGPVAGSTHLGAPTISVWGNDPEGHPDNAWVMCYEVETDGPGLFIRTHPNSDYVWVDQTLHPDPDVQQSVQVISKATGEIVKTIRITETPGNVAVHFEFNADGTEVWVSNWNRGDSLEPNGEIVIFDAETLEEIDRVEGLYAPTGKFNVYNRSNHVT